MRSVALPLPLAGAARPDGGLAHFSELGFGCAALLGRASRAESLQALTTAFDSGITLFDTARSYGYGQGEALLGEFLAPSSRRQRIVLCTKFGILPSAPGGWRQRVKPAARLAVRLAPGLRRAAQKQAGKEFTAGQFSLSNLKTSLEASLRALRTDFVDILLLHAAPADVLDQTDLLEALDRLVEQGTVRVAGISADLPVIAEALQRRAAGSLDTLRTAQFALDPSRLGFVETTLAAAPTGTLLVANHPFGGPAGVATTRAAVERLRHTPTLDPVLRDKLSDAAPNLLPEVILGAILHGTGVHAVIPAMVRPDHLRANIRAVEHNRFTAPELATLRAALLAEAQSATP